MTPEEYRLKRPEPFQFNLDAANRRRNERSPATTDAAHAANEERLYRSSIDNRASVIAASAAPRISEADLPPGLPDGARRTILRNLSALDGECISKRAVALELLPDHHYRAEFISMMKDVVRPAGEKMLSDQDLTEIPALNAVGDLLNSGNGRPSSLPVFGDGATVHSLMNLAADPDAPLSPEDRQVVASHFVAQSRQMGRCDRQLKADGRTLSGHGSVIAGDIRQTGRQAEFYFMLNQFDALDAMTFDRSFTKIVSETCGRIQAEEETMTELPGLARRNMRIQLKAVERQIDNPRTSDACAKTMADTLMSFSPLGGKLQEKLLAATVSDQRRRERQRSIDDIIKPAGRGR